MSALTYLYDMGLSEPVDCHFSDTEDGPALAAAYVGGVDIKPALELIPGRVPLIESIAYSHLERQAVQINGERRYELFSGTREALGQLSVRRAA